MNKKFKLRGYNEGEYFRVVVYDSLGEMRKAARRHAIVAGEKDTDFRDALGVTHTFERIKIFSDGKEEISNWIGVIRLAKNKLDTYIVAHELIHAAMHHYRLTQNDRIANFGDGIDEKEEDFGMIYAKYFSKMNRQLYKHRLWGDK